MSNSKRPRTSTQSPSDQGQGQDWDQGQAIDWGEVERANQQSIGNWAPGVPEFLGGAQFQSNVPITSSGYPTGGYSPAQAPYMASQVPFTASQAPHTASPQGPSASPQSFHYQ